MQEESHQYKKISVDLQLHEVIIELNTSNYPVTLDINCRERDKERRYWASFKITDFDSHIQALFQKIDNLFEYISQNTEEIEIQKNKFKLRLTYLKQAKDLTLTLHKMIMCSAQEQNKLKQKIYVLQAENANLKNKIKESQGLGLKKLTYEFSSETLNIISYQFTNFCQIRCKNGNFIYNLLKISKKTNLPPFGIHYCNILITDILGNYSQQQAPTFQIGIKGLQNQKSIIRLNSLSNQYQMNDEQKVDTSQNIFEKNDFFTVKFNMDMKQMILLKNFRIFKHISWKNLNSSAFWPHIRLLKISIKTDLFIQAQQQAWGIVEILTKQDD